MQLWFVLSRLLGRLYYWLRTLFNSAGRNQFLRRPKPSAETAESLERSGWTTRPKSPWVRREVLRLKALMPDNGCRKIASTFCYLHSARGETVSKSFVANLVRTEAEAILRLRRDLKNRVPRKVPRNLIWALDLTFLPTPCGTQRPVLGVIDHGSRACLTLQELTSRRTLDILRVLLDIVDSCGKPGFLRTDNDSIFTSWLFRFALWLLGIRHQRTAPFAPWQNGRIERLFLTLKQRVARWKADFGKTLDIDQAELDLFRAWYNGVRPHQHLEREIVPAEAWAGKRLRSSRGRYFAAWGGALTGFY